MIPRAMKIAIVTLGLIATAAVALVLVGRIQRMDPTEMALGRALQPGVPLAEVTALLRRLDVPFTVDSTVAGATIVKYGHKVARDGRSISATEQHIVFGADGRLREMFTAAQIQVE
jgi:hypothetical protein